jgi:hypothetical protein
MKSKLATVSSSRASLALASTFCIRHSHLHGQFSINSRARLALQLKLELEGARSSCSYDEVRKSVVKVCVEWARATAKYLDGAILSAGAARRDT